jgi:uncharacterized protein YyaL (SSP411 family)
MASGGMYDQLAGGFARYSVDAQWVVPHFEKMLYDNALLLRVYAHLWRATGDDGARRVALETADFLLRDLRTEQGGFASALDADTQGEEGLTYVWTPAQLLDALGDEDGRWAVEQFDVTERGTFEHGSSVLQRLAEPDDAARYDRVCARLREVRATRPQPGRDDKVVAAWNGLAIAALAEAGALFTGTPSSVDAARRAAELLAACTGWTGGCAGRRGTASPVPRPGCSRTTATWPRACSPCTRPPGRGAGWSLAGTCWTSSPSSSWTRRLATTPPPTPRRSCTALRPGRRPDPVRDRRRGRCRRRLVGAGRLAAAPGAGRGGRGLGGAAGRAGAAGVGWALAVGEALLAGPLEVAVSGPAGPERDALAAVARASTSPGAVVVVGEPDAPGVPLLAGRPLVGGRPAAYVCRGFVCSAPVTDVSALGAALAPS